VYNDGQRLGACLAALEAQTYSRDRFELIVVDNGSDDPPEQTAVAFPQVRFAIERRPGPYAARNAGIDLARGDVLAFTDSDCTPATTWIERGVRHLHSGAGCGLVGGRIDQSFRRPNRPTAAELWAQLNCFNQQWNVESAHFAATGNLFILRQVIDQVGRFPVARSGGDVILGWRVREAGYRLTYADDVRVVHPATPSAGAVARRIARFVGRRQEFCRLGAGALAVLPHYVGGDGPAFLRLVWANWRDARLARVQDRLRVLGIVLLVHGVAAWESLWVRLGGALR
jgi:glycosyltransferase involved in cell wall biosynthesis